MKEFQDTLFDLELSDHPFFGPTFTWSNKQQESHLVRKLDRVIFNPSWFTTFPKSHVEFQAPVAVKTKRETIRVLVDDNGNKLESYDEMDAELIGYFTNLIGTENTEVKACDQNILHNFLQYSLPSDISNALIKEVTREEIKEVVFCQVVYKAVTKILVKRLTNLLPNIVSRNQTTFVKGRNIDNTLLAQELVRGYGRKTISPRCSLKIDIHKAFDSLHWDFISAVLNAIGLPRIFIKWVEACFTGARYSISFNGSLIGYFKGPKA
ncbi:uncharacterized protein LOC120173841 [Hibiscus syriacus]|uniref:uncharacterized protein LOC120173841 n=1 Tax=Hibiscus syriacus TaxID=106335 RepID=UPI001921C4D8|nr:uncharacterized protein LOC120173841 [Hibiscus syriacus]